jgi:carbon-monoxide dehydrogenase medium subunit
LFEQTLRPILKTKACFWENFTSVSIEFILPGLVFLPFSLYLLRQSRLTVSPYLKEFEAPDTLKYSQGIFSDSYKLTPKKFDYYAATSLDEALSLLEEKEDAKILAGGQSLLALMKLRLAAPQALIDITKIEDLSYVREERGYLAIGALTIHDLIEHNETIRKRFTLLADAASKIGDQQIRNRGTIGGSACHADPAADLPTALLAANAQFVIRGHSGQRVVPAEEFFVDTFTTAVQPNEVLTEIRIPEFPPKTGSGYIKHSRREGDFAIVGVGAVVTLADGNICKDVRIGLGSVAATPIRAKAAEDYLRGKPLDDKTIIEAAERGPQGADPPSDMHGSREYRLEMIKVFIKRTVKLALTRV